MRVLPVAVAAMLATIPAQANAQWYQGPSGGKGGQDFDHWSESNHADDIGEIDVWVKDGSIVCFGSRYRHLPPGAKKDFVYGSCPGWVANGDAWQGVSKFFLDEDEYLLGVAGGFDDHINSLRFWTNKRGSPAYGGNGGSSKFGYTAPSGQMIVAFTGRVGAKLDALGVMYAPCNRRKYECK